VLEGIAAAMLLLASVVFALQVTAVTPLTASTTNQHLQTQEQEIAAGLLSVAEKRGTIRETVLHYSESASRFHGTGESATYPDRLPTAFGDMLEDGLDDSGSVYNVNLRYLGDDGTVRELQVLHQGVPSDHAVTATRSVVLYDTDRLRAADGTKSTVTVAETDRYFAEDVASGPLYNVIRVEVVVWRV
jgi:hypothetical protein